MCLATVLTLNALIAAEEFGITSANVSTVAKQTKSPEIRRMLGVEELQGRARLGLAADWAVKVIAQTGNFGEIFERNLGPKTPLGIARGLNAQWTKGGLMYAAPFR